MLAKKDIWYILEARKRIESAHRGFDGGLQSMKNDFRHGRYIDYSHDKWRALRTNRFEPATMNLPNSHGGYEHGMSTA